MTLGIPAMDIAKNNFQLRGNENIGNFGSPTLCITSTGTSSEALVPAGHYRDLRVSAFSEWSRAVA